MKNAEAEPDRRVFALLLLAATLLAGALRFYRLGDPSFWSDEIFQLRDALGGQPAGYRETLWALRLLGIDVGSLDFLDYASWREGGLREWHARFAAAVIGTLTVPILAGLSAGLLGRSAAALAALLLAVHPWHLEWSQNARFYAPMFLYFNACLLLYWNGSREGSVWKLVLAMLLAFAAVNVKPTSLMVFGVIGLDVLYRLFRQGWRSVPTREWGVLGVGALACLAVGVRATMLPIDPAVSDLRPFTERPLGMSPQRLAIVSVYFNGPLLCLLAGTAFWAARRLEERTLVYLASMVAVPLVAFSVLSFVLHTTARYTFMNAFGWTALAAAAGWGFFRLLRPTLPAPIALAPVGAVVVASLVADATYFVPGYGGKPRWRHAFDHVRDHRAPGDAVFAASHLVGQYYLGDAGVRSIKEFESFDALAGDTWFVVRTTDYERGEGRAHFLDAEADLRAIYPTRTPYPQSTLRVYHYAREGSR